MTAGPYIRSWRWPLGRDHAYYREKYGPFRVVIERWEDKYLEYGGIERFEGIPTAEDVIFLAYDGPECDW